MAFQFSVGSLVVTPTTGTQFTIGTLQDVSIDFDITLKELFGSYEYAVDIAPATKKINGKAKFASINAMNMNDLFFKGTFSGSGLAGSSGTVTYTNQLIGTVIPSFQLVWNMSYAGKTLQWTFNRCISKKLAFAGKMEDYVIPDFDFMAGADSNNSVFTLTLVN